MHTPNGGETMTYSKSTRAAALMLGTALSAAALALPVQAQSAQEIMAVSGVSDDTSFCGTAPIRLGIHDAFGINGWSRTSMAAVRSEAARCPNVEQVVRIGQGDLQRANADVNGMVAQGIDALVIVPSLGQAQLPSLRNATRAGVHVVPWAAFPGGEAGRDFLDYVDYDPVGSGRTYAEWAINAIGGSGNIVFLGGPAGNPVTASVLQGVSEVIAQHPGVTLLTGDAATNTWPVTNWDTAQTQRTMVSLLSQHDDIDAIINDADGFSGIGVIRAFEAAGREMVPYAVFENNQMACDFPELQARHPNFQLGTQSGRNWVGRIAVRKAIAAAQGLSNDEPAIYDLEMFEDTIAGIGPFCDPTMPPDASISARLSADELDTFGRVE